jgi:glycosyltransferase involved in cell wall biosynthesis
MTYLLRKSRKVMDFSPAKSALGCLLSDQTVPDEAASSWPNSSAKSPAPKPVWQILDVGSIWMREFASALGRIEATAAWQPRMLATGAFQGWQREQHLVDPPLQFTEFPLQRGYARAPLRWLMPFEGRLLAKLKSGSPQAAHYPLICSTPFYAPVAEGWPGPVIYYSTDLTSAYAGLDASQVNALEKRLCQVADLVCPNSRRIAAHLQKVAGCDARKITVVPNATRSSNIAAQPRYKPGPLPSDIAHIPRPIVGVLGDLSGNMDWELIAEAIRLTPGFSWVFVGPTHRAISDEKQSAYREWTKQHAHFPGAKPYGELQAYARSLDVAVLPYRKHEPTYSGSSTRFYEHLAALRPMVASRGFAELLEKEPLLTLIDTPQELVHALKMLKSKSFRDGQEQARWQASHNGTWEERALTISRALRAKTFLRSRA